MDSGKLGSWTELEFLSGQPPLTESRARELTSVQTRISARGYDVRLSKLNWPGGGELRLASSTCWMNTILTPSARNGAGPHYECAHGLIDGPVVLAPPAEPILVSWHEPEILALTCLFDPAEIVSLAGLDWNWAMRTKDEASPELMQSFLVTSDLLAHEMLHPDLASPIRIESLITYLACQLYTRIDGDPSDGSRAALRLDMRQMRIIRELTEDGPDAPTAGLLADALGMSVRSLGQFFKTTTGGTIRSYLAEQRIIRAKRMLVRADFQIKKVAAIAGFSTTSAFAAAFRKSTGLTPHDYRASQHLRR